MNGHHRDRSTSEERPRTRNYEGHSDSNLSAYSDDFEPDTKSRNRTPPRRGRVRGNEKSKRKDPSYNSDHSSTTYLHSSATSKVSTQSTGRGLKLGTQKKPRPKHGWRSHTSNNKTESVRRRPDNITTRMLSAKQRKINEMQNELGETEHRLESIQKENKLLKTVQHRQDKALRRFQDVESDLPRLISQNFEDQRVLKTRLKKAQEAERILEDKLHENNDEMQKMERTLRKLKKVVYEKNLGERSELARQLTTTENNLTVTERKIKELEKKLELTTSSFTRQIKSERQKHKETKEKLNALVEDYQSVQAKLKEKERALNVNNIYSNRHKENSVVHSNVSSPRKPFAITSSATQTSEYVKDYSYQSDSPSSKSTEKIKSKQQKAIKGKRDGDNFSFYKEPENSQSPGLSSPSHPLSPVVEFNSFAKQDQLKPSRKKESDHQTMFLTASHRSISPSPNNSLIMDSIDFEKPQMHSANDTLKNEEMNAIQEAEKQRKLSEERNRLAEEKRRKTALLAKMREIEQDEPGVLPIESPSNNLNQESSFIPSSQHDTPKGPTQIPSNAAKTPPLSSTVHMNPKSKAELVKSLLGTNNDTDPVIENLHLGLPSNGTKTDKPEKEISFGGYAPSVGTTQASRKPRVSKKAANPQLSDSDNDAPMFDLDSGKQNKKSDLLEQLFGEQEKSFNNSTTVQPAKVVDTSDGTPTPRAKPVHSGYPWEKNVVTTNGHVPNKGVRNIAVKASASFHDDDIEELAL